MKVIGILMVITSCLMAPTHSSFWQFQKMVKHITGRSAFFSYYGYGCYCGLGGKGTPVDATDRCCLEHDCCYEKLKQSGCQPVLNSYHFHMVNGTVVCVTPTQGGIMNLNKMVKQVTRKTPFTSYWPYGCHCGLGGKGPPIDATDWCCHAHDCCYHHLKLHHCRFHSDHYTYNFTQGDILCSDKGSWCEQQLCACDKEVAFCLQRNLGTYNKSLRYIRLFRRSRCKGQTPLC